MLPTKMQSFNRYFQAMASRCEICLAAANPTEAQALAQLAIDEVLRIEAKYSRYRPDSVVSTFAAQAGQNRVACDDETLTLLDYAGHLFEKSGGLFDATSGVLRRAWKFPKAEVPSAEALQALCALVGWAKVEREGPHFRLPLPGMELDFGGFGKEYAADRAASTLLAQGVHHGYVNLAGDIRVMGPRPDGQAWRIGIQDPRQPGRMVASLALSEGAVATSGDYARYFELDSRRFCHILDPRSGLPVAFWRSVSVQAESALEAGALATIAMLQQEQALAFLDNEKVMYLAVDQAGALHGSEPPGRRG